MSEKQLEDFAETKRKACLRRSRNIRTSPIRSNEASADDRGFK